MQNPIIIATGPLSSSAISESISKLVNQDHFYFYDAAAPIITYESLNLEKVFRFMHNKGGNDYINCPLSKDEYYAFYKELVNAEEAPTQDFEQGKILKHVYQLK